MSLFNALRIRRRSNGYGLTIVLHCLSVLRAYNRTVALTQLSSLPLSSDKMDQPSLFCEFKSKIVRENHPDSRTNRSWKRPERVRSTGILPKQASKKGDCSAAEWYGPFLSIWMSGSWMSSHYCQARGVSAHLGQASLPISIIRIPGTQLTFSTASEADHLGLDLRELPYQLPFLQLLCLLRLTMDSANARPTQST